MFSNFTTKFKFKALGLRIVMFCAFALTFSSIALCLNKPTYKASRISTPVKIDGDDDEAFWQGLPSMSNFIQLSPNTGDSANKITIVKMVYDNTALYIFARMFDVSSDSVMTQLSNRDGYANADNFTIYIDTYNKGIEAFSFGVYATGVQSDAKISDGWPDNSWDAVWESKVQITSSGWQVECRIPFSAIRFPKSEIQDWKMNFTRDVQRTREYSSWSFIDPEVDGEVHQYGTVTGVNGVESPLRLSFTPYVSAYLEHFPYNIDGVNDWSQSYNGGMDLKYGLNDAFTLDMTLVPDFGQVKYDNQVLNLSPFEVRYNENRPFFTEGIELFSKGGLFYSRRVGSTPIDFYSVYGQLNDGESVVDNPTISQIINATKISGRTTKGLGIGVFNSMTKPMYATVRDSVGNTRRILTDPLTNYNVLVFDQQLKNNSSVSLINTNVIRNGNYYDANVTGTEFSLNDKKLNWNFSGSGAVSQLYGTTLESKLELGHTFSLGLDKVSGRWNFGADYYQESDTWDPNDLGFLYNNNEQNYSCYLSHNTYVPKGKLLRSWSSFNTHYGRLYNPDVFTNLSMNFNIGGTFVNYLSIGLWTSLWPINGYDYFEPRVIGRYYQNQTGGAVGGFLSTNYTKKLAFDLNFNLGDYFESKQKNYYINTGPRVRVNDKLSFSVHFSYSKNINEIGAAIDNINYSSTIINGAIIFAERNRTTYENSLNLNYIFNNKMGINISGRHYWSSAKYNTFYILNEDGTLAGQDFYTGLDSLGNSLHDISYSAFNIDASFIWEFAPGSEMSLVYKNFIQTSDNKITTNYFNNLHDVLTSAQLNSFSLKVLYYLDYVYLKRHKKNK